jgi:hypothetical protein
MNGVYAISKILRDSSSVGAIVDDDIFIDDVPQGTTLPYIVLEEENIEPHESKSGVAATDHDKVRVYPYSSDPKELKTLAAACRAELDGTSGTYNSIVVVDIRFESQNGFSEEETNRKIYAKDQSYTVRVIL